MLVPQHQTLARFVEAAKSMKDYDGKPVNLDDWSWAIQTYETPESLIHCHPQRVGCTFPSINAARRYMDDLSPETWFYDIFLVHYPVNCSMPYSHIL